MTVQYNREKPAKIHIPYKFVNRTKLRRFGPHLSIKVGPVSKTGLRRVVLRPRQGMAWQFPIVAGSGRLWYAALFRGVAQIAAMAAKQLEGEDQ